MALQRVTFLTLVRSSREAECASLLVESLRSFGGGMGRCPIWVFVTEGGGEAIGTFAGEAVEIIPLSVPPSLRDYAFGDKVCACADAERIATPGRQSLIWCNPECLVLRPPAELALAAPHDAAHRPVHIRNVGALAAEPLDAYWSRIYEAAGAGQGTACVRSFVDDQLLRPCFNTHVFSFDPSRGIAARWRECFEALVQDRAFQKGACGDDAHQSFLHQAVLSALHVSRMEQGRIRILSSGYSYPYHLHGSIPAERRARRLDDLEVVVYEERSLDPDRVEGMQVREPLRSWLAARRGTALPIGAPTSSEVSEVSTPKSAR